MFGGTNPFGQSSSSPFGSQSVFGQASNPTNPFAPKPFGSPNPFGTQTGSSMFGGTSTGVFGASQPSSNFSTATAFGASSSPSFGTSTPTFGSSSSAFGGSSPFGQKPAFSGFGSTPQTSPFGSTSQPSQPAFGSNVFGSSPTFGASSQSAFGGTSTPPFGSASTPPFGATTSAFGQASTPAFGAASTPAFGSTTATFGSTGTAFGSSTAPGFGTGGAFGTSSTPLFGASSTAGFGASNTPLFGASSTAAFGASNTPAFGAPSTLAFGASSTPAFGASSTPAFGASSTPAFGSSSSPSFSFGTSSAFGQSTSAFGGTPFGTTSPSFGSQIGAQATTPTFGIGQSPFGGQRGGSRVSPYTPTPEAESSGTQSAGKLESISAMPVYIDKSHEELRWEDYQAGDKGGPNPAGQSSGAIGFGAPSSTPSQAFSQSSPFASNTTSNPFASKPFSGTGFGSSGTPSNSLFGSSTGSTTPSLFGSTTTPAFGASSSPSIFSTSGPSAFGSSPSFFSSPTMGSTPFGSGFTSQSSPLYSSTTPSFGQTGSAFGQSTSTFGQTTPLFGQTPSPFGQTTTPSLGQTNIFSTPASGFGGSLFPSTSSLHPSTTPAGFSQITPSFSSPFQSSQPAQTTGPFSFGNSGQTQTAGASGFGTQNIYGQSNLGNLSANLTPAVMQPVPVTNPFGTLPVMPQVSIGRTGTSSSIQYGISSMPVVEKPAPVRISSLLTSRHLSQRRIRLPVRKYHPKSDVPKVPFFSEDEETPSTPKADALFIPRENPRALVIRPSEQWPSRTSTEKPSPLKDTSGPRLENGGPDENGCVKDQTDHIRGSHKSNGVHDDHTVQKGDSSMTLNGHRAGEAAIAYEHGADIEALMPKLRHSDYYTEPRIQELAAKERAEPGFCRRVKDFVVGRHGYGSIKFMGETDVRRLDLEAVVQFNNREVIVYLDDNKKPPIGQGLNKPAEVTLLNIKCSDKKTGQQWTEGPKTEKYKELLKKKAEDQGAEFVSYDPVKGVWKFKVSHFSKYKLEDEFDDWNVSAATET